MVRKPPTSRRTKCYRLTPGCLCHNCKRWRARREAARASKPARNVLEAVLVNGDDDAYVPRKKPAPSVQIPGSPGKLAELASRIEAGEELWHDEDRVFYDEDDD